ncbi:MAG: APC family permease [Proteobacteria bacterium]|nr:APC family permease [Pseudomonadota bacterium]MBU1714825.1 APC family permease [Pseudomonadota bacterium]
MSKIRKPAKLGELPATAICGNDISSSVLYVSALAIIAAGQYAWIALLIVAGVLHLFRKIYGEVVGALPLNGGAYNALLNTTSKSMASLAATLTLLSYMATAVISASEAMHYLHGIIPALPVIFATILLLAIFLGISILGIGESSIVAQIIFIFHLLSLVLLTGAVIMFLFHNGLQIFHSNNQLPSPHGSIKMAIFWGFAAAMLGISGFESSANFVEEQQDGVFPKTLRNMWIVVSIFNPLMAFLALTIIPIPEVSLHETNLLSYMGQISGGDWLASLISIDAVVVLSGAVLTAYVGVTGLLERMTLDRILPGYLLRKNNRGSSYRITIVFFLLSVSILLITGGAVEALAGVYTISFLLVMGLFGIGNILLKVKREKLPRPERASWLAVLVAILAVACALWGNILKEPLPGEPSNVAIFAEYFIPAMIFVAIMLNRIALMDILMRFIEYLFVPILKLVTITNEGIRTTIDRIQAQEFVFFTRGDNLSNLNKVLLYIQDNEHTRKIKIVTVNQNGDNEIAEKLDKDIEFLDREYPEIDIEFVSIKGKFGPELIQKLSKQWHIPVNFMFIGSPGDHFPYRVEELGGVRLII